MSRPTINFFLRVEKDRIAKDKSARVYLRITIDNKQQPRYSTGLSIPLRKEFLHLSEEDILAFPTEKLDNKTVTRYDLFHWDNEGQKPTKGCGNMQDINRNLDRIRERANKALDDHELMKRPVSALSFAKLFKNPVEKQSFYDYCYDQLYGSMNSTLSDETLKTYETIIGKLDNYSPGVRMRDIDVKFLTEYYNWMLTPKKIDNEGKNTGGPGNNKYTAANNMKVIRTMFCMAMRNGDFPRDYYPFKEYKIKDKDRKLTTRDFLEIEEVFELEKLYQSYYPTSNPDHKKVTREEWADRKAKGIITPSEYRVLRRFLLACYTGLRFRDTTLLDRILHVHSRNIRKPNSNDVIHRHYIELDMHKTGVPVLIPLIEKAVTLLGDKKEGKVFEKISNQKLNKYLKILQKKAGIEKKLTFHVARHTFATIAFEYEISEKVVQEVLGHQNRKYTEIYTHLTRRKVFMEMEKLNDAHKKFMFNINPDEMKEAEVGKLAKILPMLQAMPEDKLDKLADFIQMMIAA